MTNPVSLASLQEENERLKHAVAELSMLNDLAKAIGATNNSEKIIKTIVHRSTHALEAEQGVVTLVEEQEHDTMRTLVRTMMNSTAHEKYHFKQALLGGWRITRNRF